MKRREFITLLGGAVVAGPLAAHAQQSHRVPRIGVLLPGTPTSFAPRIQAFVEGLRDLGYVEGRTVAIEWKWGQDRVDRLLDRPPSEVLRLDLMIASSGSKWAQQTAAAFAEAVAREDVPASPDLEWLRACVDYLARGDA